jgi:response regulator RpfG family c-di-GMP phosphodiesterase
MAEAILLVDDDSNILSSLYRILHRTHKVDLAASPAEALAAIQDLGYAVIVSDLQMPGMNGIQLLSRVKEISPDTVRVLLTGAADLDSAIDAVNEGCLFRFLRKPCAPDVFVKTVDAGLAQHRLLLAEQRVLQETLMGTVAVLIELLSTLEPIAFGHAATLQSYVRDMALRLGLRDLWQFEAAAILSQIGCLSVDWEILDKHLGGKKLGLDESVEVRKQAAIGERLLERVPRLQAVARIIGRQNDRYDGREGLSPEDQTIAWGAQLLRVALDFDLLTRRGLSPDEALERMQCTKDEYNPAVFCAFEKGVLSWPQANPETMHHRHNELEVGAGWPNKVELG